MQGLDSTDDTGSRKLACAEGHAMAHVDLGARELTEAFTQWAEADALASYYRGPDGRIHLLL
jgi:hypothetical protein